MKNLFYILAVTLLSTQFANAQNWTIYQADLDPLTQFSPAFEESNTGGVFERTQIADPDNSSNNLLRIVTDQDTDGSSDNYQLRQQIGATSPTAITVVFRAKGNDAAKFFLFDMDMDFNTFRSQIRIHNDGTIDVANGTATAAPDPLTINTQEWNTYRFTRDGDQFALYVNEDPTPVVTGTGDGGRTNDFFRFGDGWGSSGTRGISTDFDWVTWDLTGAFSPSDQALPAELMPAASNWTTYQADSDPLTEFMPAFEESNVGGENERSQVADPDNSDNNLLRIVTAEGGDGSSDNYQLRQRLGDPQPSAITVVFRAKGNDPSKTMLFDMDMDFNTFRSQIRILTDGSLSIANGTEDATPDPLTINTQEWNTYRFTRDGDQFALYVNEESTPVVTGTADGDRTNDFFRFGDGWGDGGTKGISTDFDWVTWDLTGAFSPDEQALPEGLVPSNWTIYQADLDPLTEFVPAFEESNVGGENERSQVADPDNSDNNLLRIVTAEGGDGSSDNYQLRQRLGDPQPTAITVVFRAKGNDPSKTMLFDMDMDFNTFRSQIRILTDGSLGIANGTEDAAPDPLTINTQEWNTYRFTRDGDQFALYVNEESTPVVTGTADGDRTNDFFRFGDGWGDGGTKGISTDFDWVTWDLTGAYSPDEQALPEELVDDEVPVGDWTTYQADLDPLTEFTPTFEESNVGGENERTQVSDPDRPGNNLLRIVTAEGGDGSSDNYQLRQRLGDPQPPAITVVFKAKGNDAAKTLLFDMDMDFNTFRSQIRVLTDGSLSIANGTEDAAPDPLTINTQDWNTYRFTRDGDQFALYVNEESTPVVTGTADGDRTNDFFRFGDGWGDSGTKGISTDFDWVTWDLSGAYSPSQTRLPDELVQAPLGDWTVYEADLDPVTEFVPAFEESNVGGENERTQVADPEDASNNLLRIVTAEGGDGSSDNYQLRHRLADPQPTAITVVFKAKGNDAAKTLLFDMDMDFNTFRSQVRILTDGTLDVANGTEDEAPTPLSINTQEFNIYRFTRDGDQFALYVNEETTPVVTGTADGDRTNNFFRFGDGWGDGGTKGISTDFDWVVWDVTGAYSPYARRLPDELTGNDNEEATPSLVTIGLPDALIQDLGFPSDNTMETYRLSGADLKGDITVTPPTNFEVSVNQTDWFDAISPLVIAPTGGVVEDTTIYVRLNSTVVGEYSGDISHTSDGAETQTVTVSGTTVDLVPEITLTGTLEEFIQNLSTPSASQNYRVSGVNLKGAVTVTAPTDFEVSADDETWQSTIDLVATDRSISNALVYVRLSASALGNYSGSVSHTATDAIEVTLAVAGEVIPDPGINVTSDFTAFSQSVGTPSEAQTYTVSGSNLATGIAITMPSGFEISYSGDFWFESMTLAPLEGNVESTTLFVRLNATTEGTFTGDIVHSSEGIDNVSQAISGTVELLTLSAEAGNVPLSVWPNPSSEKITFSRNNETSEGKVTIYTVKGEVINVYSFKQGNSTLEVDINSLPQGLYLFEYEADGKKVNRRFVKR